MTSIASSGSSTRKRKRPGEAGARNQAENPRRANLSSLGVDLPGSGLADRNLARLHRLRNLADEVDVEQAVLKACAGDLDMVGELEAALEGAGGDAAIENLTVLACLFLLLA